MPTWFDELAEFLRIPSISADPAHAGDVIAAGTWVRDLIRDAGGSAELIDWHGQPLAIGELRASRDADTAPTVLCYGHFDVQPADPLDLWDSAPFEPEIRGDTLYGRGVADDKGQLYMLLSAARELAQAGELPVNVRFTCDGEEETGGNSIIEFLAQDERGADAAVIFDTGMVARGVPAFNIATRGVIYFHLTLRSGERDLHSGMYGGAAMNAAHALIQTLSALLSHDGRLTEALREGAAPATREELDGWAQLPAGAGELADQGARPADARAAEEFYRRTFAEPTFEVNGIETGSPHLEKTVIPVRADANVSMRLAPGQDPAAITEVLERLLHDAVPEGASLEIERKSSAAPGLVEPDSRAIQLGLQAFERAVGVRPLLIRSGGTLPIVPALATHGIPVVITGFSLPDANIHSPNERMLVEYIDLGIAASRELLREFAAL
jgi:acetylornithine deacetylase/succinyl-diaminopimelate desuccinylase-like protein